MPKMKTKKAAAKRFKRSGGGRYIRPQATRQHKTGKKTGRKRGQLRQNTMVSKADENRVKDCLPYA